MAYCRVETADGYTVMSNYHLRDMRLSLKARGLLSQILSLPEKWDMTISGLSKINRECSDTIASIIKELEATGYITRYRERRKNGTYGEVFYDIRMKPRHFDEPKRNKSERVKPKQMSSAQLSKEKSNKEKENKELFNINQSILPDGIDKIDGYRAIILENIEYDLIVDQYNKAQLVLRQGEQFFLGGGDLNLFEAVKENVSPRQVADYYGIDVRNDMVSCLFHDERTPSMKLYDDHFYCFGCSKHGDVTDMVGELFEISPKEAAEKIAHDFGISYDKQYGEYKPSKDSVIAKIRREQENAKKNHTFRVLCDYLHLLKDWRTEYAPKSAEEQPNPLFIKALTETDYIESLLDCFVSGTKDDVADIVKDENGSIAKIEKTVMKFSKPSAELTM